MTRWVVALLAPAVVAGALASRAAGHGLHGHIHVTGWAIENLPPGELRDFFADPEVFAAALAGAMFPDTGYAVGNPAAREYAEYSHWEPFVERFVQHLRHTYGPTYETREERLLVAFLLGCAAHGLQDELFDSTFLFEVEERDGPGQEATDPGTDGFLVLDGYFRLLPSDYLPVDEILPLYLTLGQPIDRVLIEDHVRAVRGAYVNDFLGIRIAASNGMRLRPQIPWAAQNYLDPGIAGSLAAEIVPTARHLQALWERLHGRFDEADLVVYAWPQAPRRLRSADHRKVASWITLVLGKGIEEYTAMASLTDTVGTAHPFDLRYTRWGGTSRLVRFQPASDFLPGGQYVATLEAGALLVDGTVTARAHSHAFQVECGATDDPRCPPVAITGDPTIAVLSPTPTATPRPAPTPTAPATACVGDCSGDGTVAVDELLVCVTMAMNGDLTCTACDADADAQVTVDELLRAVTAILNGC